MKSKQSIILRNASTNSLRALVYGFLIVLLVAISGCFGTTQETVPSAGVESVLQGIIVDGIANTTNLGIAIEIVTPRWNWSSAAGLAALDPEEKAAVNMYTRIASVTKTYSATAIMKLVQDGTIGLDDLLATHLPEKYASRLTNADIITIRETLQHTAGIPDYNELDLITRQMENPDTPVPTEVAVYQGLDAGSCFLFDDVYRMGPRRGRYYLGHGRSQRFSPRAARGTDHRRRAVRGHAAI